MLLEMKKYARYNWIPVILDDSLEFIKDILVKQKPKRILEIGTAIGYSSAIFSDYLEEGGNSYVATLMNEIRSLPKHRDQ